jgi:hypothetical protein
MLAESALKIDDAKSGAIAQGPRVSLESMRQRIAKTEYLRHDLTTICILTLVNGFKVIGHSTPASGLNFNEQLGQEFAYENAVRQLWQLEGYLLRERMTNAVFSRDYP